MAITLETFVKQLTDSGVIAPGKLENFIPPKAHPKDAPELARQLVQSKQLTKYQVQEISAGRAKSLILGNYTILDKIGAGGMGQVFKAQHRRMDRTVAIKMLPKNVMKDPATIARFEREVKAAAKLEHPNIVAAHDADEAGGVHFLVMQFVDGQDLSAMVKKNGPFSVANAVNYILQAARGLEFAHGEGVIHRDIKPANLLLDKKGTVKILDMGLARIETSGDAATQAELTGTGAIMGTVDYMAPEQALSTKHADARADIYSLGCSLFYLLTGKSTYEGDTLMAKLLAHREKTIPSLGANVPEPVQAVFEKMVAKKIEDRYQSMTEVVAALEQCDSGQATSLSLQQSVGTGSSSDVMTFLRNVSLNTIKRPKAKPVTKAAPVTSERKNKSFVLGAVGAGLLGVLVLAGIFVSLKTKDGTLIVEVDQPDAMVQVLDEQGTVEISQKGGVGKITIGVDPGKHRLKVEKDGFAVFGQEFELEKGGKKEITAKLEPVKAMELATVSSTPGATGSASAPPLAKAPFNAAQAKAHQAAWARHLGTTVETTNSVGAKMILIPPGEFLMGSTDEQVDAALKAAEEIKADQGMKDRIQKAERPQHRVVITRPFLMGATEVTVGQFKKFSATDYQTEAEKAAIAAKAAPPQAPAPGQPAPAAPRPAATYLSPGYPVTDDSPAAMITWNDAVAYCKWLSEQEKTTYRLPTEAEWEYACRAGTTTQYSFGDDYNELLKYGWHNKNASRKLHPVGTLLPNGFGLFDMHGNLQEWCGDYFDEKWYSASPPNDPNGPFAGGLRVIRDGPYHNYAYLCRSAHRGAVPPSYRSHEIGFRCVRVVDATTDTRLATGTAPPQPNQPWNTPAFQAWTKEVQAMPADEQWKVVAKKLQELNPGFDGKVTGWAGKSPPKIDAGAVTEFGFVSDNVTDISPVRALVGLKALNCSGTSQSVSKFADLSPLQGMQLASLDCTGTKVASLSPLQGMPLTFLRCQFTSVSDLSPLQGMKLTDLNCAGSQVSDLSPLRGMPLTILECGSSQVSDLSPLRGMPLTILGCGDSQIFDLSPLQGMRLTKLSCGFSQVSDLSPLAGMNLTDLRFEGAKVSDLSPLKGMRLTQLRCDMNPISDLSPLAGMRLLSLHCGVTQISDLSPLRQMPLARLYCSSTRVSDLSPLEGMHLTDVVFMPKNINKGLDTIRQMKSVKTIGIDSHALPPDEFWKKYDAGEFGKPISNINDPAFQAWMKTVAAMPAEKQVEAVSQKLIELNPGFDGKVIGWDRSATPKIENGVVTELGFITNNVIDISPVRALLGLTALKCVGSGMGNVGTGKVADLSPLQGLPLVALDCGHNQVSNLSPLAGMKLTELRCGDTKVSDLSPLQGMPVTNLMLQITKVSDLSPLHGMPLTNLTMQITSVSDLTPLEGMNLIEVSFTPGSITKGLDILRQMKSLSAIRSGTPGAQGLAPTEFWRRYDAGEFGKPITTFNKPWNTPAFQHWMQDVQVLPAEKQIEAVSKKLMELNPGFDGKLGESSGTGKLFGSPKVEYGVVTTLAFISENVTDISPLRALSGLSNLSCAGSYSNKSQLSDLSPLQGLPLTHLTCGRTQVSDLSPLRGMNLKDVNFYLTPVNDLSPLKGMKLTGLGCEGTQVSSLLPLAGMPLTNVICMNAPVSDLTPLQDCKRLTTLNVTRTKVTPASVAALQKALPNCKIEWDDPSKPKTPQPPDSGTK